MRKETQSRNDDKMAFTRKCPEFPLNFASNLRECKCFPREKCRDRHLLRCHDASRYVGLRGGGAAKLISTLEEWESLIISRLQFNFRACTKKTFSGKYTHKAGGKRGLRSRWMDPRRFVSIRLPSQSRLERERERPQWIRRRRWRQRRKKV